MNQPTNSAPKSNVETQLDKIKVLMDEGKTLDEALAILLTEVNATTSTNGPRKDQQAYIRSLRNIPEVRRCRKIAYAKISKSKGKEAAIARYRQEITTADEVLNSLLAEVTAAETPWVKAMELGEDAAGAFNYFLQDYKAKVDKGVGDATKGMTQAQLKAEILKMSPHIGNNIPEQLQEACRKRLENGDMMVVTVLKKANYLESQTK